MYNRQMNRCTTWSRFKNANCIKTILCQ